MGGANIEIREKVGADNFYLFGLKDEQIRAMRPTYHPREVYEKSDYIKRIVNALNSDVFCQRDHALLFKPIYEKLLSDDFFFVLADLEDFNNTIHLAEKDYLTPSVWFKKAILNVARIGYFSSDRAVMEYAKNIWHIKPVD